MDSKHLINVVYVGTAAYCKACYNRMGIRYDGNLYRLYGVCIWEAKPLVRSHSYCASLVAESRIVNMPTRITPNNPFNGRSTSLVRAVQNDGGMPRRGGPMNRAGASVSSANYLSRPNMPVHDAMDLAGPPRSSALYEACQSGPMPTSSTSGYGSPAVASAAAPNVVVPVSTSYGSSAGPSISVPASLSAATRDGSVSLIPLSRLTRKRQCDDRELPAAGAYLASTYGSNEYVDMSRGAAGSVGAASAADDDTEDVNIE